MEKFTKSQLDRLPADSRQRAIAFLDARNAKGLLVSGLSRQIGDLIEDKEQARAKVRHTFNYSGTPTMTLEQRDEALAKVDAEHDPEITRKDTQLKRYQEQLEILDTILLKLKDFMSGGAKLKAIDFPSISADAAKNLQAAIAPVDAELDVLDAEFRALLDAPFPAADLKKRITEAVNRIAGRGEPKVDPRIRVGDPARLDAALSIATYGAAGLVGDAGSSFFMWIFAPEIIKALHAKVDELDLAGAMSEAQRSNAVEALATRRLKAELQREAIIQAAAAQGVEIDRRVDADPRSILGCVAYGVAL